MTQAAALMAGKRGLVMGVANDRSMAWGIAKTLAAHGAELALTYQVEQLERRVRPLAESLKAPLVLLCDATDSASLDSVFDAMARHWGSIDYIGHPIAYTHRNEMTGK